MSRKKGGKASEPEGMITKVYYDFCKYISTELPSVTARAEVEEDYEFGESYPLALVFNLDLDDRSRYRELLKAFRDAHPDELLSVRHHYKDETQEYFPEMVPIR